MARFEKGDKVFEITSDDGRYAIELQRHLRAGWTRVADPRCEVPLGAEPHDPVLEDALRADPGDVGAALVYADWLQQQGHPRGALIAVQHRLASNPGDAGLVEEERRVIEDARDALISKPILAHLAILRRNADGKTVEIAPSRNFYAGGTATFDHGFIREALVVLKQRAADEDALWELLRHPSTRVLARLGIVVDRTRDVALVAALLTHGPRPPLRALAINVEHRGSLVDLAGIDAAYPELEELELSIHNVRLGELELPRLRQLRAHSKHTDLGRLLAARPWPRLEVLSVVGDPEALSLAFSGGHFPKLRTLSLAGLPDRDLDRRDLVGLEMCRLVTRHAAHVEVLEMPALVSPEAITMLVENRPRFARLVLLRVGNVRADQLDRLRAAGYPLG